MAQVGQVSTPTLILHGGADDRCPVGQAEQWFTALRERGVAGPAGAVSGRVAPVHPPGHARRTAPTIATGSPTG